MPDCQVRLIEQTEPSQTFGFGIGLATRTQHNLRAADSASFEGILEMSYAHEMAMVVDGRTVTLPADNLIAVGRAQLLDVLREYAGAAGVQLEYGHRGRAVDLAEQADLVVAADGVSSSTRAELSGFGGSVTTAKGFYLWAGAEVALRTAIFAPVATEHGTFVAHAYPYAGDRSTFLVETDEETWRRAGFDRTTEQTPSDSDDRTALDYLSDAFADHLDGQRLIGNRTRWLRFRTVSCKRWHDRNIVLLGDAVHTAHYSIGSGTKLAMEDGIALANALDGADDLDTALAAYEAVRRPAVEHLQSTAVRSMRWWESFATRLDLPVERLWVAYMTRAGKVSLDQFGTTAPEVARSALAQYADCPVSVVPAAGLTEWVLAHQAAEPSPLDTVLVGLDDPWGPAADDLVKNVGVKAVLLTCRADRESVLTMLDVGERMRREAGACVVARVPAELRALGAAALVSGRADVIRLVDEADGRR
jgi:anthraniloyl-CoA monooxygenase